MTVIGHVQSAYGATAAPQQQVQSPVAAQLTRAAATTPNGRVATVFEASTQTLGKDDEHVAWVKDRFKTIATRFLPDKAKGVNATYLFDIEGAGKYYVTIKNGKLTVAEGSGPKPNWTWSGPAEVYHKITIGEMNKTFAYMRRKFKISGDDARANLEKFPTYFKGNDVK